jgi:hypothetical protein
LHDDEAGRAGSAPRLRAYPDETEILNLRYLPERHKPGKALFAQVSQHLDSIAENCPHRTQKTTGVDACTLPE